MQEVDTVFCTAAEHFSAKYSRSGYLCCLLTRHWLIALYRKYAFLLAGMGIVLAWVGHEITAHLATLQIVPYLQGRYALLMEEYINEGYEAKVLQQVMSRKEKWYPEFFTIRNEKDKSTNAVAADRLSI